MERRRVPQERCPEVGELAEPRAVGGEVGLRPVEERGGVTVALLRRERGRIGGGLLGGGGGGVVVGRAVALDLPRGEERGDLGGPRPQRLDPRRELLAERVVGREPLLDDGHGGLRVAQLAGGGLDLAAGLRGLLGVHLRHGGLGVHLGEAQVGRGGSVARGHGLGVGGPDPVGDRVADRRQRADPCVDQLVALVELEPRLRHRGHPVGERGAGGGPGLEASSQPDRAVAPAPDGGQAHRNAQEPRGRGRPATVGGEVVGEVVDLRDVRLGAARRVRGGVRLCVAPQALDHPVGPLAVAEGRAHGAQLDVVARGVEAVEGPAVVVRAQLTAAGRDAEHQQRAPSAAGEAPSRALRAGVDEGVVEGAAAGGLLPGDHLHRHPIVVRGPGRARDGPVVQHVGPVEHNTAVAQLTGGVGRRRHGEGRPARQQRQRGAPSYATAQGRPCLCPHGDPPALGYVPGRLSPTAAAIKPATSTGSRVIADS
ncbi:unannotated protein [freshwater metagenome]|uniref:Unannotated protein n=1 Tax=freshwater metagenome TaxID=449393 RepID=A0A6J7LGT4_9ZZZZ